MKVKEFFNRDIKPHWIRNFIKNSLKYSFKRGSSRNKRAKSNLSIYAQAVFSSKLMTRILQDRLIINIDESSYGRSIRNNYSWLPKSQNSGIINTMWSGRLTLIWGLASNGDWIWMSTNMTTTTEDFCIFMHILRAFVDKCCHQKSRIVTAVIDDAAIHLTEQSKSLWKGVGVELLGLPQYCPHLAPCELVFGMTKKVIINQVKYKGIDFSKSEGEVAIMDALGRLENYEAVNMWRGVMKIWKTIVVEVWIKIKDLNKDYKNSDLLLNQNKLSSEEEGEGIKSR